jgi:predicted nucleotidyltransferase
LAHLKLRDRDAIITKEGLIHRVYGYSHPSNAYICDPEYSPATLFTSANPKKAIRTKASEIYYKFYEDEGLRFIQENYPQYTIVHKPLQKYLVGISRRNISEMRKTDEIFQRLIEKKPKDELLKALRKVFQIVATSSSLSQSDFGVFGSILHGFYHPKFSDLDFVIYGKQKLDELCQTLGNLYNERKVFQNEFENNRCIEGKRWKFLNYSPKEFVWHQKRKMIYALFNDTGNGRDIKTEFEPVKRWEEIRNEYDQNTRIVGRGWIKAVARITDDSEAPFMPSIYPIEPIQILDGVKVENIHRIQSFVEEFRMQAKKDEEVNVEGNLEQVTSPNETFHQITLTYCPRYYGQVMKVLKPY